jgi:hypothetical protein
MKHKFYLPALARGIVVAAVLASFAATATSRAYAQVTVYRTQYNGYYNPFGQGLYGGSGEDPENSPRPRSTMFESHGAAVGNGSYGYPNYGNVPSGNSVGYGNGSYVRSYGGTSYYQPFSGPVYVPFGY